MFRPLLALLLLVALPLPASLQGQGIPSRSGPPTWSAAFVAGSSRSDAARNAEAFLVERGWNHPSCFDFFGAPRVTCRSYPYSDSPGPAFTFDVNYRRGGPIGAGVVLSTVSLGRTRGRAEIDGDTQGTVVELTRSVRTLAPVATYSGSRGILQIGPAIHTVQSSIGNPGSTPRQERRTVVGFLAGGGLRLPLSSLSTLEARVQYRHVAGASGVDADATRIPGPELRTHPAPVGPVEDGPSHWFFGVGVGWRR